MSTLIKDFPYGRLIFFVTENVHKFNEARSVLAEYDIAAAMVKMRTLEVQDDDIENIARVRVLYAVREVNLPVIVEDAGLFIDALGGFPGPYSSYVYRKIGLGGILKLLNGVSNRSARFRSVVAFCDPNNNLRCFHGVVEGRITLEVRGFGGFGFDPIFEPNELPGKTFGEMTTEEKCRISHRARALREFAKWYRSWQT